ncbi:HI0074 family nucleotidyltransferase substrate-binding subunit [Coraliomargarita parva]|uniref:HI0074 family nucleotidyltransferase substrate-binding subunit n=1 Tax=Coraliomargarita parva TaxID=3014050 RepID=UPI0022B34053|nr:HI0074 family nucleotidyltransferase substrate-binding subunit [Coraliomargarita parva]
MEKLASAKKALTKLEAILDEGVQDEKTRDAAIQRFEFTSEICWKALQAHLKADYAEEVRYPKGCYETAFRVGLIDEDLCLALNQTVRDRNLTSHTYHETVAIEIFERLPLHAAAFRSLVSKL